MSMFKRMTDKLGHLQVSSPKPGQSHANFASASATPTAIPVSPASSYASTANTLSTSAYPYAQDYGAYQRGSISTERTSLSGYSNNNSNIPKPVPAAGFASGGSGGAGALVQKRARRDREESMHHESDLPQRFLALRPKGSYRLSDFIIQRTLGTGSFGTVHLGSCSLNIFYPPPARSPFALHTSFGALRRLIRPAYSPLKTQSALLRDQGHEQREDCAHQAGLAHAERAAHALRCAGARPLPLVALYAVHLSVLWYPIGI